MPEPFPLLLRLKQLANTKNGCGLTPPTLRIRGMRYYYGTRTSIHIYVYVIARVGVKFGINLMSVRLSGNKIARGEAECYLPLNLTRVKFVPEISRLTVLLKINTIASLLFI